MNLEELEPEPPIFHGSGSGQKGRLQLHNTGYRFYKNLPTYLTKLSSVSDSSGSPSKVMTFILLLSKNKKIKLNKCIYNAQSRVLTLAQFRPTTT